MTVIRFHKDPDAVLDYTLDWSDFLTTGDTISASEWFNSSTDININSETFTDDSTTIWVASGIENNTYDFVNHITTAQGREDYRTIEVFITEEPNELSDLVYALRIHLGDSDPASYRYMDNWLLAAVETSIKSLQRWWGDKYVFDSENYVIRNPDYAGDFLFASPPVIQDRDQRPIILMAAILVKSGQLEKNSWSVGSWRDAEIAVSNIEGSRAKEFSINLDWNELQSYLKPPSKRLFPGTRNDYPEDDEWTN